MSRYLKKRISIETAISIVLSILILLWLFNKTAQYFFVVLYALLAASVIMLVYLSIAWRRLSNTNRRNIVLNIIAWLFLAYCIIHANGLTVRVLLMND